MKNKKGNTVVVLLLLSVVAAIGWTLYAKGNIFQSQIVLDQIEKTQTEIPAGWKTFKNETHNYEIGYPGDWEVRINKDISADFKDTHVYFHDPKANFGKGVDGIAGNVEINVRINYKPGEPEKTRLGLHELKVWTTDEYKMVVRIQNSTTANFKILKDEKMFGVSCAVADDTNWLYRYCVKNNKGYEFKISGLGEKDMALGKKIISTFKFTN